MRDFLLDMADNLVFALSIVLIGSVLAVPLIYVFHYGGYIALAAAFVLVAAIGITVIDRFYPEE